MKEKTFNFPSWQEGREGVELMAVIPQIHRFQLDFDEHLLAFEISRIYFFDKAGRGFWYFLILTGRGKKCPTNF